MVKTREHGAMVELISQRPEVESGDYHTKAELETRRPKVDSNHSVGPPIEELKGPSRDKTKELA